MLIILYGKNYMNQYLILCLRYIPKLGILLITTLFYLFPDLLLLFITLSRKKTLLVLISKHLLFEIYSVLCVNLDDKPSIIFDIYFSYILSRVFTQNNYESRSETVDKVCLNKY